MAKKALLFDIGGTNMRFGISLDGRNIEAQRIVPTPKNYEEGIETFKSVGLEILAGVKVDVVVGGIAGSLAKEKSEIYNSPHLPNWSGKPFKADLLKAFGGPVWIENDTAIVGLGESVVGVAKGYSVAAYFTVSTGVNGVRIEDGHLSKNFLGYEIGHQIIDYDAETINLEYGKGELEDFISGAAIEKRSGMSPLDINDSAFWEKISGFLVTGLYNTVLHWSPEILVLGGALMNKIPFDTVKLHLTEKLSLIYPSTPRIEKAILGEFGGLHGALIYSQS